MEHYYQADFFQPPPERGADLITESNELTLVFCRLRPTGAEAREAKAAREREYEARQASKAGQAARLTQVRRIMQA